MAALSSGARFTDFASFELNERGLFMDGRVEVAAAKTRAHLARRLEIQPGVTDVFVWVHGWRNSQQTARKAAARLFHGINSVYAASPNRYTALKRFKPQYVAVHWPSVSLPTLGGYRKIRNRAHAMTQQGAAEFVLASLLGYLDDKRPEGSGSGRGTLRAAGGYCVHCIGHSFGGRFLAEAIAAAATPTLPVLRLLPRNQQFDYTVDTLLVLQMAAPPDIFKEQLSALVSKAPLQGPVVLTHSGKDRANCFWHKRVEKSLGIGCERATEPAGRINWITLRPLTEAYTIDELAFPIVNVKADWLFNRSPLGAPEGAHSDFWYEESIHLLLTLADLSRDPVRA